MKYTEFGAENEKTLMIFVGGGVYWNPAGLPFIEVAEKYYHIIMVAYDGFNGDEREKEAPQEHIYEHEAMCAIQYIKEKFNGKIDVMYGCSAGAWILTEVLHSGQVQVKTAIVDGMDMKSFPKWWRGNISNLMASIIYKSVTDPKFATKVTGQSWEELEKKICTWVTKDTYQRLCAANCGYQIKFDAFEKADMHVWYGDKGKYDQSFRKMAKKYIGENARITMKVEKNCGHGGLFAEPERMMRAIMAADQGRKEYVV